MKSIEKVFENYSTEYYVKENFEDVVYAKIKRKKAIRKAKYSSLLVFSFFLVIFLIFLLFPVSTHEESREIRYANHFSETDGSTGVKEEIPVMENVFFASFDDSTDYAIEQVILAEEDEGI